MAYHILIQEGMGNLRARNSATMTIINPRKENWRSLGSKQQTPVLKSGTLLTRLWAWPNKKKLGTC